MAYKFQLGPAVMSGSLTQEGGLIIKDDDGSIRLNVDRLTGELSGSGDLKIGGAVKLDGVADAAIDVQSDSLYFLDADGLMKKEAVGDLMAAVAGNGLSESADQLQVNVDDSSIEISADTLQVKALGITDAMLAGSISDAKLAQDYVQVGEFTGSFADVLATHDTDDLAEGSSNLYYTDARARAAISEDADILSYNSSTGVLSVVGAAMSGSTLDIVGDASAAAAVRSHFSGGEMIDISSGVVSIDGAEFSGSWDAVLATKDTDDLSEGSSNLYFTDARARQAISVTDAGGDGSLAYDNSTGVITYTGPSAAEVRAHFSAGEMISISSGEIAVDAAVFSASADVRFDAKLAAADTDDLSEGASNLYWTVARGESMFDSKLAAADTDDLSEGQTNLYFTNARAQAAISVSDTNSMDLTYAAGQISADLKLNAGDGANSFEIVAGGLRLNSSVAGSGLTLSAGGVLSVDSGALNAIGDANGNLAVGFNYASADVTADRTWTLPASPAAGDVVHIKAALVGSNKIIVAAGAGDTIDGVASIEIESDQGAVSLMAISDSAWKIF